MPGINNAATFTARGRHGNMAASGKRRVWENSTHSPAGRKDCAACSPCVVLYGLSWAIMGLTEGTETGKVKAPNHDSRNRRLSLAPQGEKALSAQTAIFRVPAWSVSSGQRVHIGRVATSSIREDWRLIVSRGALLPCLSFLIPNHEASHD